MKYKIFIVIIFIFPILFSSSCRDTSEPPSPEESNIFEACIPYPGTDNSLDIVTFNVEMFPANGYTSVMMVSSLLNTINADVYALQEVASKSGFEQLLNLMPGYTGLFYPINNSSWNLAFIFKTSEISVYENSAKLLFTDSQYYYRPAYEVKVHHKPTNIDTYIINNHFKCCGDGENARREASALMKDYIDTAHPNDAVIVLGDLNDEITGADSSTNPFLCFINDPDNFHFADMGIAKGSKLWWSYPDYPSHIDHILVTNELFQDIDTTLVYKAAPCYPEYETNISDHRPVGIKIVPSVKK